MDKGRPIQEREDGKNEARHGDLRYEPVSRKIYLDFNASTPICPEAVEAMRPFLFEHYGNPSSLHWAGMPAKDAVEKA